MNSLSWQVPGRIEVFGKHTDYAGGNVLVCAIDRGVCVTISPGQTGITAQSDASEDVVKLAAGLDPGLPRGHWGRYLQTVVDRLATNFGPLEPVNLSVTSDLPLASGMSSSSALIIATAMALIDYHGFNESEQWTAAINNQLDLAGYLAAIEGGGAFRNLVGSPGVGTKSGSEDHTAAMCSSEGYLGQFSFSPMQLVKKVAFPADYSFVIGASGVRAEKTGAARDLYNRASQLVADILSAWNLRTGRQDASLAAASLDGDISRLIEVASELGEVSLKRLNQFLIESNQIVPAAVAAFEASDFESLGACSDESHALAASNLGNQIPETMWLATSARSLGALAASGFGAGFGGSVWALVPTVDASSFAESWLSDYREHFPEAGRSASSIITRPSASAKRL